MITEIDNTAFAGGFDHGNEGSEMGGAVAFDFKGGNVGMVNEVAKAVGESVEFDGVAFEEELVVGEDDESERFQFVTDRRGGDRASGKVDALVRLDELTTHHEEDEELEDHVDERGHIDPGINAALAGDQHGLLVVFRSGEIPFAQVRSDFVEIVDQFIDTGFEDLGHGHGGDGDEESGDGGEEASPDAVGEIGGGDGIAELGDFGKGNDHAPDGAEEPDERGDCRDEGENTQAAFVGIDELGGVALGDIEAMFFAALGRGLKSAAEREEGIGVAFWDVGLLEFGEGFSGAVSMQSVENEAFEDDRHGDERENQEGPHEAAAFEKEIFY